MSRPEILFPLFAPVANLKGIGGKSEAALQKIGIKRIKDLLFHLPQNGIERVRPRGRLAEYIGRYVILKGEVGAHKAGRSKSAPYRIQFYTKDDDIELTFFHANAKWLGAELPIGNERVISGKLERYGDGLQIIHPDFIGESDAGIPEFEPHYGLSEGISQKQMRKAALGALEYCPKFDEWLRQDLMERHGFPAWEEAIKAAHHPKAAQDISLQNPSRLRLAYDELLSHQLALALIRARRKTPRGRAINIAPDLYEKALAALPFALTGAQSRTVEEIFTDLKSDKRMFRLVQGDVGSGKTAVAFLAMVAMAGAGMQSALLAPTEILAKQHYMTLSKLAEIIGFNCILLTGADNGAKRREKYAALADGQVHFAIGTHALFQDEVKFQSLGLAVIDEQHRFGVNERKRLAEKGAGVDLLTMSATPIPRSLSMAIYGEMDISVLDEKPPGRRPVETSLLSLGKLDALTARIKAAIEAGRQVYWVCPLVSESEVLDFTAAEDRYLDLRDRIGAQLVGMVHGQMPSDEKEAAMARFVAGEAKLLVATTAIEVGVDVPNASIMVIEGAERFGLSQLHQLRGRVGRGAEKSNCILVYGDRLGETARERLELMRETEDGFKIAEVDMKIRGVGDMIGTAQSGLPRFRIADLEAHGELMRIAHDDARMIVENDPELQSDRGAFLRVLLYLFERDQSVALLGRS